MSMESSLLSLMFQSLIGLAAVLGLFALMVWAMRRLQTKSAATSHDFSVVQRMYIDSKNSVVEIRHRGQHYLLGLSPAGMTQLHSDQTLSNASKTKTLKEQAES